MRLEDVQIRRLVAALALIMLVSATAACAATAPRLAGRAFLSVAVTDGGVARPLVAGTRIRLDFQADSLGASAGCNSMGGTYRIEGGRLIFEGGAMTEMACDPARDAQDRWLIEFLASRPAVTLVGDELTLASGTVVVRLMDRKVVEPDATIAGPTWTVVSIITGDSVSSVPAGATATLVFNADGTVAVNAGCNEGSATWAAVGGGIRFADLGLTKKACPGPAGELESAVVAVLGAGTIGASIEGNVLTLQAGARGLQLQAS